MEDQGKRLLLAVVIAFGIMLAWNYFMPAGKPPPEKKDQREAATQTSERPKANPAEEGPSAPEKDAGAGEASASKPETKTPAKPVERGKEQLFDFDFKNFDARFSSYGGSLVSWKLSGKRYYNKETGGPENLVPNGDAESMRDFQVSFPDSTLGVPKGAEWHGEKKSDRSIAFTWSSPDLEVTKLYEIVPDEYLVKLTVTVENRTAAEASQSLAVSLYGYQDPEGETGGSFTRMPREWKGACYLGDDVESNSAKSLAKEPKDRVGHVHWAGFNHSFFLAVVAPNQSQEPQSDRMECNLSAVKERAGAMRADLVYPSMRLKGGDGYQRSMVAYLGPKYLDKLEGISAEIKSKQGFSPGFDEAVNLGWLTFLARPLLWLLKWFQSFLINWGLAIIFLTLVVKLATLPWTHKSMKSMKAMAKLKPQMEKIREKYADDKQRQQVETMNLFKAHKVNPLAGCLPMLLQMPVWIALYRSLTVAAELYQAPFIPGWIDDLTRPDPYHIMPVLLIGMMYLQSRLTPTAATGAQQKLMQYGMPLMIGVMSFFFPAGLTLYIFTNTLLTAGHHLFIHRGEKAAKEGEAAKEPEKSKGGGAGAPESGAGKKPAAGKATEAGASAASKPAASRKKKSKKSGKRKKRSR